MASFIEEMDPEFRKALRKLPLGDHGLPVPDIRILNEIADDVIGRDFLQYGLQPIFRGHLDDYVLDGGDGNCGTCDSELVRVVVEPDAGGVNYFQAGLIICPNAYIDGERHPFEFWLDVWPHAAFILERTKPRGKINYSEVKREIADLTFRYSNSTIRRCYDPINLTYHFMNAAIEGTPNGELSFPEPDYVHDD